MSVQQMGTPENLSGGYFEFDDGGWYAGNWINGQAYGLGKCTGPQGKGEYSGTWQQGFEVSGEYTWPNGHRYAGDWTKGKRSGLGVESKEKWVYKGEWMDGLKGKYGVKYNTGLAVKYEGSWHEGLQDGYGVETYLDKSTYQGQWSKGKRHGFGVRKSAPKGVTFSRSVLKPARSLPSNLFHLHSSQHFLYSSNPDNRRSDDSDKQKGGFVLIEKLKSTLPRPTPLQRTRSFSLSRSLSKRLKLMRSGSINAIHKMSTAREETSGGILRGSADIGASCLVACSVDVELACAVETYAGEWKWDKRCGFGVSERSDGLKYEGGWLDDMRDGYGVTTYKDGVQENGKYHNNQLIATLDQKHRIFTKKKFRDRLDTSVAFARKAAQNSSQKAEVAAAKRGVAVKRAIEAEQVARRAAILAEKARKYAKQFYMHYEDEGSKVPKQTQSISSWSDKILSDDVFNFSSNYNSMLYVATPPHNTLPNNAPKEDTYSQLSFQHYTPKRHSAALKSRKTEKSLNRPSTISDFEPLRKPSQSVDLMRNPPRKRTSKKDILKGSSLEIPASLRPGGTAPSFRTPPSNVDNIQPTSSQAHIIPQYTYLPSLPPPSLDRVSEMRRRFSNVKKGKEEADEGLSQEFKPSFRPINPQAITLGLFTGHAASSDKNRIEEINISEIDSSKWIRENLIAILFVLLNLFSAIYFVFSQKNRD